MLRASPTMAATRRWNTSPPAQAPPGVTYNASAPDPTSATNVSADANGAIVLAFMRALYMYDEPMTILLIGLYLVAFVAGLLGNVFVIAVVVRHSHMRSTTNMFLVNLAVGDLLVIVVGMPFTLAPYIYRNYVYGVVLCKLTPFIEGISVSVSVLTLLAISIDRLYAILRPMQARLLVSGRRVFIILVAIWLVAVSISSPVIVVNDTAVQTVTRTVYVTTCEEKWRHIDWKNSYNVSMFVMLYVVPLLTMTAAYVKIARVLWRGSDVVRDCERPARQQYTWRLIRSRRRSIRLLVSVVTTFAVTWFPYHVVNIYLDLNRSRPRSVYIAMHVYPLVQWLGLANSACNPLCYCFFSRSFYNAFVKMCCCCRRTVAPPAVHRGVVDCGSLASTGGDRDVNRVTAAVQGQRSCSKLATDRNVFALPRRRWATTVIARRRCSLLHALKPAEVSISGRGASSNYRDCVTTFETSV